MKTLEGRVVWITGGGSGIGRAAALLLAESGAQVIVSGRRQESLRDVVEQGRGLVDAVPVDVADQTAVMAAAEEISERYGAPDTLINAAGHNVPERTWSRVSAENWDEVVAVNASGAFYCCQAALPAMRSRKRGLVVNVSSWGGRFSLKLTGPAYAASKSAMISLTETLNLEEGENGIRATVILPAAVNTEFLTKRSERIPEEELARMLQPQDLARLIRFIVETPEHVCLNEILLSPTHNYVYQRSA